MRRFCTHEMAVGLKQAAEKFEIVQLAAKDDPPGLKASIRFNDSIGMDQSVPFQSTGFDGVFLRPLERRSAIAGAKAPYSFSNAHGLAEAVPWLQSYFWSDFSVRFKAVPLLQSGRHLRQDRATSNA